MTEVQRLLGSYVADVEDPQVSGIEHHHMLRVRDRILEFAHELSEEDRTVLVAADRKLVAAAQAFAAELSRFVDLAEHRREQRIEPARWWWYLDVLAEAPRAGSRVA